MNNPKEEKIDELVRNIWGGWGQLKDATERLKKISEENNGEKPGSRLFNKELIGNIRLNKDEFRLACKAIHMAVGRLEKEERVEAKRVAKEEELMSEYEYAKGRTSEEEVQAKKNEILLRETHPHFDAKNFK